MRLPNNDDKVVPGQTAEQCADACEKESSFPCRSYDYDKSGSTCYLSRAASGDTELTAAKGFDYYEMSKLFLFLFYSSLFEFCLIIYNSHNVEPNSGNSPGQKQVAKIICCGVTWQMTQNKQTGEICDRHARSMIVLLSCYTFFFTIFTIIVITLAVI